MSPADDALLRQPVIVIGAPRSGTTLLARLLGAHPSLSPIPEPRLTWRYGNDGKSDLLGPEDARPEVREHIRRRFAALVREHGGVRVLEKTPSNALRMGFVDRVFPGCQFVHIRRNAFDSILSIHDYWQRHAGLRTGIPVRRWRIRMRELDWKRAPRYATEILRRALPGPLRGMAGPPLWGPRIPGLAQLVRELDLLEVCCLQWRMCVELACQYGRNLPSERYMEIRLDDLSREMLGKVADFFGLEPDPELDAAFERQFDAMQVGGREQKASPETLERIRTWILPTLEWLGEA